jgi:hypothetical protein
VLTYLASVFPDYAYPGPLGLLQGDAIFANGVRLSRTLSASQREKGPRRAF